MRPLTAPFFCLALLLFIRSNQIHAQIGPAIKWQKCIGGSGEDKANDIRPLPDGGYIIVGYSKSNDGDVTGHHGIADSADAWVCRLGSDLSIRWQRSMGGSGSDEFRSVTLSSDGGFVCFGTTGSRDGDAVANHGGTDFWVVKFAKDGSLSWQSNFGGTANDNLYDGTPTSDGGYALIGNTFSIDGDVTGLHGGNGSDTWVVKISGSGTMVWQKCFGNSGGYEHGSSIMENVEGDLISLMSSSDAIMPGDFPQSVNGYWSFMVRLNNHDGTMIGAFRLGGRFPYGSSLSRTPDRIVATVNATISYPACAEENSRTALYDFAGNRLSGEIVTLSNCISQLPTYRSSLSETHGTLGIDDMSYLGCGTIINDGGNPIPMYSQNDAMITMGRFNPNGDVQSVRAYGGSGNDQFNAIRALPNGTDFVAAGQTTSNDYDVSGNHGGGDIWLVGLAGTNHIEGHVFIDRNSNGVLDPGEKGYDKALVKSSKVGFSTTSIPYGGEYRMDVDTGNFVTELALKEPYYNIRSTTRASTFTSFNRADTADFAIEPIPGKRDYAVFPLYFGFARPGDKLYYDMQVVNQGTDTFSHKPITFVKDVRTHLVSATPSCSFISGDTLEWDGLTLFPDERQSIHVELKLDSVPALKIGDTLFSHFLIDSTGDLTPSDNHTVVRQPVQASFDPNGKTENGAGLLAVSDYMAGSYLNYRIDFQNTGNDTAFTVIIRDTLTDKADPASIEMIAASHPYRLNLEGGHILIWRMDAINLPDSLQDEARSHGYLSYRVKPIRGLSQGDSINNGASIYFDHNPPVLTDIQQTVLSMSDIEAPIISDLQVKYCGNSGVVKGRLMNPPSSHSASTLLKLDSSILILDKDSTFSMDISVLQSGQHTFTATYSTLTTSRSSVFPFDVKWPDTPRISLGSSVSLITDASIPVQVTVDKTSGGGDAPLYAFSTERGFSSLIQAESGLSSCSIDPATLAVGDNWIYARIRTSSDCYYRSTYVDSIKLQKNAVTGISDPDNPGHPIKAYPNPFSENVTVSGLLASKKYEIRLTNLQGQLLMEWTVSGKNDIRLNMGDHHHGIYQLHLFDLSRNVDLGAIRVMKVQ